MGNGCCLVVELGGPNPDTQTVTSNPLETEPTLQRPINILEPKPNFPITSFHRRHPHLSSLIGNRECCSRRFRSLVSHGSSLPALHDDVKNGHTIEIQTWYYKRFWSKEKMKYNSEREGETKVKEVSCNQLDKEAGQNRGGIPKNDTNDGLDEDLEDSQHLVTFSAFLPTANFF
ncbi:hypothetical protein SDJN03_23149, partial [Cucurbita argyrosperma subsp. sororia]